MRVTTLSDDQAAAEEKIHEFIECRDNPSFVLNGLAGTGKTTLLSKIAREYPFAHLCTLTGKAASILRRKTGLPASTIHHAFYKLLEGSKHKKDARGRPDLKFVPTVKNGDLRGQIVLIDECSMINHELAKDILNTGANIIACGDPGQLPPVSGTRYFNKADAMLTEIHRQALESPIIRQAHAVRAGNPYQADGEAFRVLSKTAEDDDFLTADVILCFTNNTKAAANNHARRVRGFIQPTPQVGEPVVCLRNAADYGIFNGATYLLEAPFLEGDTDIHINVDGELVTVPGVRFMGVRSGLKADTEAVTSFDFGYAMTVHKAQGSEWSNVLLLDEYARAEHRKEWLYTAITRAADRITIVR